MKTTMIGVFAVLLGGSAVSAADIYQAPAEAPYIAQPTVVETSGWYLRGDAAFSYNKLRGANFFQGSNANHVDFTTASVKNSYTLGVGAGYQINRNLRTDVTLDYLGKADFRGSTVGGCGVAVNCVSSDISSFSALSVLANAYVDVGTYGIFTPYVGAGIGGTRVSWDNLRNTSCDVTNPANCDPTVTHEGRTNWRLTYALMAGASIDVTCNLKADIGYRYRRVLAGGMFGFAQNGGPGSDKGFNLHEARGGLRYSFGGCEQAYAPPVDYPVEPPVYK